MSVGFISNGAYKPVGTSVVVTGGGAKPEQTKEVTITENGTTNVTPDAGKVLTGVGITVDVPSDMKPEQTKEVTILANGTSTVTPDSGKVLSEVEITVNVPSGSAATHLYGWNCHDEYNGEVRDYPMIFNYNTAKDTLAEFQAGLSIDGAIYNDNGNIRQNMELRDCSGWNVTGYTKLSDTSFQTTEPGIVSTFTLISSIPVDQDIAVNQSVDNVAATIDVSQYSAPVEITPSNPDFVARKVTVTLDNIPSGADLEANKAATIDVSQYSAPVEVTPTAGKDGMEKVTVTLDNIPSLEAKWEQKTWAGLNNFRGVYTWTDGTDVYYSNNSNQYVLDKATSTWSAKTWTGLTQFNGSNVWTDGTDIYYSNNSNQYVLDKATSTWSVKTWGGGFNSFNSENIWTDGENIYYSYFDEGQYVLDKATSAWSAKTWYGYTYMVGYNIWTDGTNIYYSNSSNQYVLDKATSTWSAKTWTGITNFDGRNIWTDGTDIYCDYGGDGENGTYILDKSTSTWSIIHNGIVPSANDVWTDGTNTYYSNDSDQYILNSPLENKATTIDVSQYSAPVEVTPSAGKNGMGKVTVTLDNIPSGGEAGPIAKMYGWSNGASTIYTGTENPTTEDSATTNLSTLYPITAIDTTNNTITVQGTVYTRNSSTDITMGPGDSYMYAWDYSDSDSFSNGSAILPVNKFEDITLNMKGWICDASSESLLEAEVTEISNDPDSQYVTLTSTKVSGYSHTVYPDSRNKRLAVIYDIGVTGKLYAWIDVYYNTVMYTGESHNIGDIAIMGNNGRIQNSWSITDSISLANEISYDNNTWKFNNNASGSYTIHNDTLYAYKDGSGWVYTENSSPAIGDKVMYISFDGLPVTAEITAVSGNDITWYSNDTGAGATSTRYSQDDVTLPGSLSEYLLTSYEHSEQEGYILTYKLDSTSNDKVLTLDYSTTSRPKIALSQSNITSVVAIQAIKTTHSSNELLRRWERSDVLIGTSSIEVEVNKATTIDVSQYSTPVEVTPTSGKDAMGKVTVTLDNIPSGANLEVNKAATINVSQYSAPVEVTPTAGKDGMEKVTVTLNNIPRLDFDYKDWGTPYPKIGTYVWSDGDNIYYSNGSTEQLMLTGAGKWVTKTWSGASAAYITKAQIWTDGTNTYLNHANSNLSWVLNKATSTWSSKTWNGLAIFDGKCVWTDGDNIYYSHETTHYVLDTATSTWSTKTWNGLTNFEGNKIWTDGTDYYYEQYDSNVGGMVYYVLDKTTSTWSSKTWYGLDNTTNFNRYDIGIWTDGDNIYYSDGDLSGKELILDKATSTWSPITWSNNLLYGKYIWTNGENVYYSIDNSYKNTQYVLKYRR